MQIQAFINEGPSMYGVWNVKNQEMIFLRIIDIRHVFLWNRDSTLYNWRFQHIESEPLRISSPGDKNLAYTMIGNEVNLPLYNVNNTDSCEHLVTKM